MSDYENVIKGKLKLKGKALDVKASGDTGGGVSKKKKHKIKNLSYALSTHPFTGRFYTYVEVSSFWRLLGGHAVDHADASETENGDGKGKTAVLDDHLMPAGRRYLQHLEKIDRQRLAKMVRKSHRDWIQEFNQYLANLTEHNDIPKVGPG
ncbi:hypothetical protein JRO89_XS03G0231800 [Xanthoceras sorbifolium]|uniref:Uncharacterized protein n=1 Tax=Xanthoceras sorbifolium TaxID=99658 RepID=A0ABQ8IBG2_9ROSI|nr:hypothetical protein JRO89_XS03G0231800 [Xanthoceras sorbifolium]